MVPPKAPLSLHYIHYTGLGKGLAPTLSTFSTFFLEFLLETGEIIAFAGRKAQFEYQIRGGIGHSNQAKIPLPASGGPYGPQLQRSQRQRHLASAQEKRREVRMALLSHRGLDN